MPHFGLMNEDELGPEQAALMRARLHIRGGKRRLSQGKISAGILTLYDALLFGMEWFVLSDDRRETLMVHEQDNLRNDRDTYAVLVRSGVLDGRFDYAAFDSLVEYASNNEMPDYDYPPLVGSIDSVMTQLGIMPFDESQLPPEDPKTF
ncbi:MAG: hypothetical protein EPN25_13095 [Nitrospirae bacterium]|nr:MAG: hypothetical protein EPN25_13095 [Nitrospirota bacterium]